MFFLVYHAASDRKQKHTSFLFQIQKGVIVCFYPFLRYEKHFVLNCYSSGPYQNFRNGSPKTPYFQ